MRQRGGAVGTSKAARPTAADVARLANVSTATVSYVLNNVSGQRISGHTRDAVLAAAEELGYRPNLAARNLRAGRSGVVLYVLPRMPLPKVPIEVASRLTTELARYGIVLSMQFETDDGQNIIDAIDYLQPAAVTSVFPLTGKAREAVAAAGVSQIYLGSKNLQALSALDDAVGELWVDHLVARGHRRLAFAYSDRKKIRPVGDYWLRGLRAAAARRGLPEVAVDTIATNGSNVAKVATSWIADGVTAVCAATEEAALVLLTGMREADLRCPQDLAVISADAGPFGAVCRPQLTTVAFDAEAVAAASAAAILTDLGLADAESLHPWVFTRLLVREST
jgi:DNA-binding LacI/PurR family transcriptional regulator